METLRRQQLEEPPRYNHPCGDLLESGRRVEYINICVPLYRALIRGDLEAARVILEGCAYLVRYSITEHKETPLHLAVAVHNSEFAKYLVDMMSMDDLTLQNEEGNNAFCVAAIAGNRRMAMIMLQKNRQLLTIRGSGNMMPLHLAAFHRQYDTMIYLYDHSQRMSSDCWTDDDRNSVFLKCIESNYFDMALRILNDREELPQDKYVSNVLHVLAPMAHAFRPKLSTVGEIISNLLKPYDFELILPRKTSEATHLLRKIWKKLVVKNKNEIDVILRGPVKKIADKDTYPSRILFVAAENGNNDFLVELIREYPDLMRNTNDDGQTIFHIGLSYHHESIFDLLDEIGTMKDTIAQLKDKEGNTLLHSVSKNTGRNPYEHAAFKIQRRFLWFKRVRTIFPPCYELKNAADQTPYELFNHNHKDLISEAQRWIKETSNQCMVVAALITTISFAAAFTIPGGYNQNTGFPMFLRNTPFTVFVIFDGISFISSSVSILIFLPLSFSRYSEHNVLYKSPFKLAMGFGALATSIITLMAAFSANFFVLYHDKLPIFMSSLATLPIGVGITIYEVCADHYRYVFLLVEETETLQLECKVLIVVILCLFLNSALTFSLIKKFDGCYVFFSFSF